MNQILLSPIRFATGLPVFFVCALFLSAPNRADIITDWNSASLSALRAETTSPPLAARNLAILNCAIYDAINSITHEYQPYFFRENAPANASFKAAALGAAYKVSAGLYPSEKAAFEALRELALEKAGGSLEWRVGVAWGEKVADALLNLRAHDGSSTTIPYIPSKEPRAWRRTPPFFRPPETPHWARVTPFAMKSAQQFRPGGPPAFQNPNYIRDYDLTRKLGGMNSTNRTPEQTLIARFWSDFSYTVTPPGHWNEIALQVAKQRGQSLKENARLFAILNVAMADAAIACWDAKFAYNFWRPVTAIQQANGNPNPETIPDKSWLPLLNTPPFPEYVSGHSTFSGAAAEVLAHLFGTDHITFTIGSDGLPGASRTYHSFRTCAEEIGMSRIYGGIHFLSANLDGLALGRTIGGYVLTNCFLPASK